MRTPVAVVFWSLAMALAWPLSSADAQVTDAERAAARELFKEGDELQRAGRFSEALEKFQRAQKVYSAPTNELRVAQCQAALGHLVEATESYRAVARTSLPAGSPQAFQTAVDQAKTELTQVEPRIPKLVVQVSPASASPQLQIDGQPVSVALIGEPLPLDPGPHHVRVSAQGFAVFEQDPVLKERESTTVLATLRPASEAAVAVPPPPVAPPAPYAASPGGAATPAGPPPYAPPPPPQTTEQGQAGAAPPPSRTGFVLGGHLGWELAGGSFPFNPSTKVEATTVAAGGFAFGFEGGLRFARHWYAGLAMDHAELGHGDLSGSSMPEVTDASSSATLLAIMLAFIANPDRTSFYGEIGAGNRWFSLSETTSSVQRNASFSGAELALGVGLWIPILHAVRLLPKLAFGLGSFDPANAPSGYGGGQGHTFVSLGLTGFYNHDF